MKNTDRLLWICWRWNLFFSLVSKIYTVAQCSNLVTVRAVEDAEVYFYAPQAVTEQFQLCYEDIVVLEDCIFIRK
jgi:hypothetical protein